VPQSGYSSGSLTGAPQPPANGNLNREKRPKTVLIEDYSPKVANPNLNINARTFGQITTKTGSRTLAAHRRDF
jgi:hypothetical protein